MKHTSIFPLSFLAVILIPQTFGLAAPSLVQEGKTQAPVKAVSQVSPDSASMAAQDPAQTFMSESALSEPGLTEPAGTLVKSYSIEGAEVKIFSETVSCGTDCTKEELRLTVSEKGNPDNVVLTVDNVSKWIENPTDLSITTNDGTRYEFKPAGAVVSIKSVYSDYAQKNLLQMDMYEFKTFKSEDGLTSRTEFVKFRETIQDANSMLVQNISFFYSDTGALTTKQIFRTTINNKTYMTFEISYANKNYEVSIYNLTTASDGSQTSKLAQRPVKYLSEPKLTYDSSGFIMQIDGQIRKNQYVRISFVNDSPVTERYRL